MSTSPVTLMVARRVARGRYQEMLAWLHEGEQLATDFPGYLGSGVLAPPPGGDEFQIIFRFADEQTMHAWEHSASRRSWLVRGSGLFAQPSERRVSGIDGWFGAADQR
ncbi:MAG: antibiotic biosynthesis monooxygenase, partial [Pseudomonas sp.]|nr:antibiotic biosynthesis monooxygenase [Pseudomonas sp.]